MPDELINRLRRLKDAFFPSTKVPEKDSWKTLDCNKIWENLVKEVMAIGGSRPVEKWFDTNPELQQRISYHVLGSFSLDQQKEAISRVLREAKIRYASSEVGKCRKTKALVKNHAFVAKMGGPSAFLAKVAGISGDQEKIEYLRTNLSYFKSKSARDFLMEHGLLRDAIALDTRVMNVLKALGCPVDEGVKSSKKKYRDEEVKLLRSICVPLGMTGVEFDRMLYQNYDAIMHWLVRAHSGVPDQRQLGLVEDSLLRCRPDLRNVTQMVSEMSSWSGPAGAHPLEPIIENALVVVRTLQGLKP